MNTLTTKKKKAKKESSNDNIHIRIPASQKEFLKKQAAQLNCTLTELMIANTQAITDLNQNNDPTTSVQLQNDSEKIQALRHDYLIQNYIRLNRLHRLIVNNPSIPKKAKEELIKEINNYGKF